MQVRFPGTSRRASLARATWWPSGPLIDHVCSMNLMLQMVTRYLLYNGETTQACCCIDPLYLLLNIACWLWVLETDGDTHNTHTQGERHIDLRWPCHWSMKQHARFVVIYLYSLGRSPYPVIVTTRVFEGKGPQLGRGPTQDAPRKLT